MIMTVWRFREKW